MPSGLMGTEKLSPAARRCVFAGCIGFAIDFFDIYLPVLALAPVIGYFEPKGLSSAGSTTIYFFTFAATLFGRPCGAVIFGHFADRLGRRRTTMISIAGFGALTFLIACLPGESALGIWALVLLIVLRFADGVFMGGEYTSNNTLVLEMVPRERRGFVGGVLQAAYPIGFATISAVTGFMFAVTTKAEYYAWGWRATFVFGALMAFAFLIYYRTVPESPIWQAAEKSEAPLKEVFSGEHLRNLGQVCLMMLGFWLAVQPPTILPGIMIQHLHVSPEVMSTSFLIGSIILLFGNVGAGLLSQIIGRRNAITLFGGMILIAGSLLYFLLVRHVLSGGSLFGTAVITILFDVLVFSPWGVVTTYISERFPTHVRASGYGIGYSAAVVIPGFAGFYLLWLSHLMPYEHTPMVLLIVAGALIMVGGLLGPETRDVELHEPDLGRGAATVPAM
jgi:MFS family permease